MCWLLPRAIKLMQSSRDQLARRIAQRGTVVASLDSKIDLYVDLYGGLALGAATVVALILANSPVASQYEDLLQATGEIRMGSLALSKTLEHWINDGLMAVFFLLVGLEIKREVMERELASLKGALLPSEIDSSLHTYSK
jgi:Na+/H+ antiporter NhaA